MHNRAVEAKNSSNLILVEHGTAPEGRQNKAAGLRALSLLFKSLPD